MVPKLMAVCGALTILAAACVAADQAAPKFKNLEARRAATDYAAAVKKAREDYAARLRRAQEAATRAGDLDEALKIREEIAALKGDGKTVAAAGPPGGGKAKPGPQAARDKLAARLVVGSWTYGEGSAGGARPIKFNEDGTAQLEGRQGVHWIAVNEREALLRYPEGGAYDKLIFNESCTSYDAYYQADGFKKRLWGGLLLNGK
jgi:hypothetical protein